MAEKKKSAKKQASKKPARAPSINERITDFSTNSGPVKWVPKKK